MQQRKVKIGDLVRCSIDNDIGLVIRFDKNDPTNGHMGNPICLWHMPARSGIKIYPCSESALTVIEPKEKENA